MTNDLSELRDQALVLIGNKDTGSDAHASVMREMYDVGLTAMAERLMAAQTESKAWRELADAEAERSRVFASEIETRDQLLQRATEHASQQDERLAHLEAQLETARADTAAQDAARENADRARREAVDRMNRAYDDAAAARAETEAERAQRDAAVGRAAIATVEAANARIEMLQAAARSRLELAEIQERLTAALAERSTAIAERYEAVRVHDEMKVRLRETMAITSAATHEASEARSRAESAEAALKAVTSARITFVGDARGVVAASVRSDS